MKLFSDFTRALGLAMAGSLLILSGCASNQHMVDRSVNKAEGSKALATEAKLESASTANADSQLEFAKASQKIQKGDLAVMAADRSSLEYRLALLTAERDSLKKQDEQLENDLRSDVERKLLYQNILDQETGSKEAK